MRTRTLRFGLYADEQGLARVREILAAAVAARSARIAEETVVRALDGGTTTAEAYDLLAEQWAWEHPGGDSGAREAVELRARLVCSLRTWRGVRKAVLKGLCPEGDAPHVCQVPWFARQ
ncbi:hypothetical protein ABZ858_04760 [Streptomyces sp. NPDC047017]|uniref:hypothetical protein n=1 Tax=Streptomyces sp. NPDC047017 TaxID=3155024 RepID=UPI0033EBADBB